MSALSYTGKLRLVGRDNGRSFCFTEAKIKLWMIPYRAAEEERIDMWHTYLSGPQLGEWGGNFILPFGAAMHKHLDRYWMETDHHRGDIWLTSAEILDGLVDVELRGSGDLISIDMENELKKMLYKP